MSTEDSEYVPPAEEAETPSDHEIDPKDAASDDDQPPTPSSSDEEYLSEDDEDVAFEELADSYLEMVDLLRQAGLGKRIKLDRFVEFVNANSPGKRSLGVEKSRTGRLSYFYVLESD